ncbi:MAG: hypothetical protein ACTSYC_12480 [Promethearchaeota archaeon]
MKDLHFKTKKAIMEWYEENPSLDYLALKYREPFIPHSKIFTHENLMGLKIAMEWLLEGLNLTESS